MTQINNNVYYSWKPNKPYRKHTTTYQQVIHRLSTGCSTIQSKLSTAYRKTVDNLKSKYKNIRTTISNRFATILINTWFKLIYKELDKENPNINNIRALIEILDKSVR